jgi:hypothetical protein
VSTLYPARNFKQPRVAGLARVNATLIGWNSFSRAIWAGNAVAMRADEANFRKSRSP